MNPDDADSVTNNHTTSPFEPITLLYQRRATALDGIVFGSCSATASPTATSTMPAAGDGADSSPHAVMYVTLYDVARGGKWSSQLGSSLGAHMAGGASALQPWFGSTASVGATHGAAMPTSTGGHLRSICMGDVLHSLPSRTNKNVCSPSLFCGSGATNVCSGNPTTSLPAMCRLPILPCITLPSTPMTSPAYDEEGKPCSLPPYKSTFMAFCAKGGCNLVPCVFGTTP